MAGFIGYHLARRLVDQGYEVLGIDNLNQYYQRAVEARPSCGNWGWSPRRRGVRAQVRWMRRIPACDSCDSTWSDQERVLGLFSEERFDACVPLGRTSRGQVLAHGSVVVPYEQPARVSEHPGSCQNTSGSPLGVRVIQLGSTGWTAPSRLARAAQPTIPSACMRRRNDRTS